MVTRERAQQVRAREKDGVTDVADGVLRIHRAGVNCYLIVDDGLTLIDAGPPGTWRVLLQALSGLGAEPADIDAVLLTHGHFDHVGMSDRLKHDHGVKSRIHEADRELALHPYRYRRESSRWPYPLRHPRAVPILARMTAAGALWVEGVATKDGVEPGMPLDVPGRPVAVWTPGHTDGHCAFVLPDRGALFTGDALVTLDPYTGRRGPRMVARAATADVATNAISLDRMAATEARVALPGHGAPYGDGIRAAVAEAHRAGAA